MSDVLTRAFQQLSQTSNTVNPVPTIVAGSIHRLLGQPDSSSALAAGVIEVDAIPHSGAIRITPLLNNNSATIGIFERRRNIDNTLYTFTRLGTFTISSSGGASSGVPSLVHVTILPISDSFGAPNAYRIVGSAGQQTLEFDPRGADGILLVAQGSTSGVITSAFASFFAVKD